MNKLNKKWPKLLILSCFLSIFFIFGKQGSADELQPYNQPIAPPPLTYTVKREQQKFILNDLSVQANFGTIASITITMPTGLSLNITPPTGWTTYNQPNDATINYLLTENNRPADVQAVLENISFSINDEEQTQGKITISLSTEEISSWKDPQGITHYYKFVPNRVGWLDAYNSAKRLTYKGLTGYLATITSEEEHNYIFYSIAKEPGWLGGTRIVHSDGLAILDQTSISTSRNDYNLQKDDWYWTGGPEAGDVFFVGKKRIGGYVPVGSYDGWNAYEPNNAIVEGEQVLQFALSKTKQWNDLRLNTVDPVYNEGYYVEFSSYGTQTEIEEDSYSADVPQLVKVKFVDQDTNEVLAPEELVQDTFSIGSTYDASHLKKAFQDYDLIQMPQNVTGKHENVPITVFYYYKKQYVTLHLQQVVLNHNDQLVIPNKGYLMIKHVNAQKPEDVTALYETAKISTTSLISNSSDYTTSHLFKKTEATYYQINTIIPEYYQYMGYIVTDSAIPHTASQMQAGLPAIEKAAKNEYWVTLYLQPNTTLPKPYSWDYRQAKFNKIN